MAKNTFLEAAYEILREADKPMAVQSIIDEVLSRKLWVRRVDRPETTYNSLYGTLIKAVQNGNDRIGRLANTNEFYALNVSKTSERNQKSIRSFIMIWNPTLWSWNELTQQIQQVYTTGNVEEPWSCGNRKDLPIGSRIFLFKQGKSSKGIIGSGVSLSEPKREPHYNQYLAKEGKTVLRVNISWDILNEDPIIPLDRLKQPPFSDIKWVFQASGIEIDKNIADDLFKHLSELNILFQEKGNDFLLSDEFGYSSDQKEFKEAKPKLQIHLVKERNRSLVKLAKKKWAEENSGNILCSVCSFSFVETYGQIASNFIEAHHKIPISELKKETTNRVEDLAPICSNCHRIIHRHKPWLTVNEFQKIWSNHQIHRKNMK